MAWANAQAEKAREQRGLASPDPHSDAAFEQKMNGLSMGDEEPSFPERVFMDLLAASEELTQVNCPLLVVESKSLLLTFDGVTGFEAP